MKTDWSNRENLVIPTPDLSQGTVLHQGGGDLVYLLHGHLYYASGREDVDISPYLDRDDIDTLLYPSTKSVSRWLMYKGGPHCPAGRLPSCARMADFYERFSPWPVDVSYLEHLRSRGEKVYASYEGDELASLAYSTKGTRQLVSLFTRPDMRGRGHASALLSQAGDVHIFVDDPHLVPFYNDRGFEVVKTYCLLDRRRYR